MVRHLQNVKISHVPLEKENCYGYTLFYQNVYLYATEEKKEDCFGHFIEAISVVAVMFAFFPEEAYAGLWMVFWLLVGTWLSSYRNFLWYIVF